MRSSSSLHCLLTPWLVERDGVVGVVRAPPSRGHEPGHLPLVELKPCRPFIGAVRGYRSAWQPQLALQLGELLGPLHHVVIADVPPAGGVVAHRFENADVRLCHHLHVGREEEAVSEHVPVAVAKNVQRVRQKQTACTRQVRWSDGQPF
jgi:hypothetical protein